jgi:hypothetical protein
MSATRSPSEVVTVHIAALVGFVGAYFGPIVGVLAVAGLMWLAVRAYPAVRAEFESGARCRAEQAIALIRRADQQHSWVMAADKPRALHGERKVGRSARQTADRQGHAQGFT